MRSWLLISLLLCAAGLGAFAYKLLALGYPVSTGALEQTWRLELVVAATGDGGRAVIEAALPRPGDYQRIRSEEARSGPLRFSIHEEDGARTGRWSGRLNGFATLVYSVNLDTIAFDRPLPQSAPMPKPRRTLQRYLGDDPGIRPSDPAIAELSQELRLVRQDGARLAREIFAFVADEIGTSDSPMPMDSAGALREGRANALGRARLLCALARHNGIPCRVVAGLLLADGSAHALTYWNEVWVNETWIPLDPERGLAGHIPAGRVALAGSPVLPVHASGVASLSYRFDMQSQLESYAELVRRRLLQSGRWTDRLSLLSLPLAVQRDLRVLLLVPVGALAICVLRSVVGIRTFGTFLPMLIALALTATGLLWGTVFLSLLIGGALLVRLVLRPLHLLMIARIAFILTLVILLMTVLMIAVDAAGGPAGGIGAFPFVIMTMMVERISVSLEEEGLRNTLRRLGSTMAAIYLTWAVLQVRALQTFLLVFPEWLLVVLGLLVALGRYTGYRLTELLRFRELARPAPPVASGG